MSPRTAALRIPVGPDNDEQLFDQVQIASERELAIEKERSDRRAHRRHRDEALRWIRSARLSVGYNVAIVDLSSGGALLDSPVPLRPDSLLTLEIDGRGFDKSIPFRVVRCQIGSLLPERTIYRGACEFTSAIELPIEQIGGAKVLYPGAGAFVGLDVALKHLVERTGASGTFGSLEAPIVRDALESLRDRALKTPLDPMGHPLAALLGEVVPALDQYPGLAEIIGRIETRLRQTIPQVSLRLVASAGSPAAGKKSVLINVPGAAHGSALVSIDLPRGVVLNDWQARVLRVTGRLIALLQRMEPVITTTSGSDPLPAEVPAQIEARDAAAAEPAVQTSAWQKIVVRYQEGQILKGYTHDFSPARPQFSLWPSINAAPRERVIVPLARLKGVFFVRDFAGNPGYVERADTNEAGHGRRIEVTLMDDEVVAGRTLSYRPDGYGFFVMPADSLGNNIRIFIVSSSVRQVQFP